MWPPRPSQSAPAKSQRGPRPGAIPRPPLRPGALALGVVGRPGCQEERGSSSGGSLQAPFKATVSRRGWTSWIALVERLDRHAPDPTPARRRPATTHSVEGATDLAARVKGAQRIRCGGRPQADEKKGATYNSLAFGRSATQGYSSPSRAFPTHHTSLLRSRPQSNPRTAGPSLAPSRRSGVAAHFSLLRSCTRRALHFWTKGLN